MQVGPDSCSESAPLAPAAGLPLRQPPEAQKRSAGPRGRGRTSPIGSAANDRTVLRVRQPPIAGSRPFSISEPEPEPLWPDSLRGRVGFIMMSFLNVTSPGLPLGTYKIEICTIGIALHEEYWRCGPRCLVLVGKDIELDAVGHQFEPYRDHYSRLRLQRWRPCGVIWDAVPDQSWY